MLTPPAFVLIWNKTRGLDWFQEKFCEDYDLYGIIIILRFKGLYSQRTLFVEITYSEKFEDIKKTCLNWFINHLGGSIEN